MRIALEGGYGWVFFWGVIDGIDGLGENYIESAE